MSNNTRNAREFSNNPTLRDVVSIIPERYRQDYLRNLDAGISRAALSTGSVLVSSHDQSD